MEAAQQLSELIREGSWVSNNTIHRALITRYIELVVNGNEELAVAAPPAFFLGDFLDLYHELVDAGFPAPENQIGGEILPPDVVDQLFEPSIGYDMDRHLVFSEQFQQHVRRLNVTGTAYLVQFQNFDGIEDITDFMLAAIEFMLNGAFAGANPDDLVGVQINHPGLESPILIPFRRRDQLDAQTILNLIEQVQQSQKDFDLDERMTWQFTRIVAPVGGRPFKFRGNLDEWIEKKSGHGGSLITVNNRDNLCLAPALVVAKCRLNRKNEPKLWETVRKGDASRCTKQRELSQQLMDAAGLQNHQGMCGIPELEKMHGVLPTFRIRVLSSDSMFTIIYDEGTGPSLDLLLHNQHFFVITSLAGFFGKAYWCEKCQMAYDHKRAHAGCGSKCASCFERPVCRPDIWTYCSDCNRWFVSADCFKNHKILRDSVVQKGNKKVKLQYSTCSQTTKCRICDKIIQKSRDSSKHVCGTRTCRHCGEDVDPAEHLCHMQPADDPKPLCKDKKTSLIFYDMETSEDTIVETDEYGQVFQHIVNCVCVQKLCDDCYTSPQQQCENCKTPRKLKFVGEDALKQFCTWLFKPVNVGSVVVAHNSGGFDGQFIMRWLRQQAIKPIVIMRGLKIIRMWVSTAKILFLDSFAFMPMALSAFPKAWGFSAAKGTFPHLFNTRENWTYVGPLPDAYFYGPAGMKLQAREEFYRWYSTEKALAEPFDFQKALVRYCELDVDILVTGCMKFRELCMKEHDVDPFLCASTIASTCMHIYRKNFATPETIAIVPHLGYRKQHRHSIVAIKWLKWMAESDDIDIQHARNGGEVRIGNFRVDGQLRTNPQQLYEFYGCIFHGCPRCVPDRWKQLPLSNLTAEEAYTQTLDREHELESLGYTVTSLWECELKRQLKDSPEMAAYFKSLDIHEPLDPREAFFGGRTNCRKMYHKCSSGERIQYIDICSLYPYCCKYGRFPVGHPTVITENFEPVDADSHPYEGLIKCCVLPPKDLLHPVLPDRVGGKLLFHLCRTCADERNPSECEHSDSERQFWGAWATCELYKALDLGYRVVEIAEVYHFEEWEQYDGADNSTGLFTGYINSFLKMKQEASGWPAWVSLEKDKKKYIEQYAEREGVHLEEGRIEKNPGLRSLSKLGLNSFWGKFGQRTTLPKTEYFEGKDKQQFLKLVFDPSVEVHAVEVVGPDMVMVQYVRADDFVEETDNTNPIIAAWVTAQARLKLYSYLEPLGDRVLYMDTDSVIYLTRPGDTYTPPIGDYLGDMTDELDGGYISEFVAAGPKQYAYICRWDGSDRTETCVKIRGFTLTNTAAKQLNFKTLKKMVLAYLEKKEYSNIDIVAPAIRRQQDHTVVTRTVKKTYSIVYDKCRLLSSGVTVPFGYCS